MSIPRSVRRLLGPAAAAAAVTLTAGLTLGPATPAHAATMPPVGSVVCHVGPVSGLRCGTVVAVNVVINFPDGSTYQLFRYSACSQPGDAGAPVYQLSTGEQVGTVFGFGGSSCQTFALPLD
jgi:hypothetical protein